MPDLALLEVFPNPELDEVFPGNAVFGPDVAPYNMAYMAGYGAPATPSGYLPPEEYYKVREGEARRVNGSVAPYGLSDTIYGNLNFDDGTPNNSRSISGDSGMPIYDSAGRVIGVGMGSTTGTTQSGFTFFTKIESYVPWIHSVMIPTAAPKITTISVSEGHFNIRVPAEEVDQGFPLVAR